MNTRHKRGDVTKAVAALVAAHPDMPTKQVAEQIGTSYTAAYVAYKRLGLTPVKMKTRKKKATHEINGVKMNKLKHDRIRKFEQMLPQLDERERLNSEDVAARLGMSGVTICSWLKVLGRRLKNNNGRTFYAHDKSEWANTVLPIYQQTGNVRATAKAVGINVCSVYRWLANSGHLVRQRADRDISKYKFQNYR